MKKISLALLITIILGSTGSAYCGGKPSKGKTKKPPTETTSLVESTMTPEELRERKEERARLEVEHIHRGMDKMGMFT